MVIRRTTISHIRGFLFALVNKEFLIFLFFLCLSGIFWLLMTLNETYEMEFKIPVRIVNTPQNVVLTSEETDTVRVTLHDKGLMLLRYEYGEGLSPMIVNFRQYAKNNTGSFVVPNADIQRLIYQQLPASTRISAIKGDKLEIFFNYGEYKKVPVEWYGNVTPEEPYFISHVSYSPDSVTIYSTQAKLDSIRVVQTEMLNYSNFRDTLNVKCRLRHIKGVKMSPQSVNVSFITDVLTEESIDNIPIIGINMPSNKMLRTFPSKVSVRFVSGVRRFKSLSSKDFYVVVDYDEIVAHPSEKCDLHLKGVPHGISRAKLNITKVDYIIENEE